MTTQKKPHPRSVARLAAVQGLYQMETAGTGVEAVIREFSEHRFDRDLDAEREGSQLAEADETYFADLLRGVVARQAEVDRAVTRRLAETWKLTRLDATARALLRVGAYELMAHPETPVEVVLDDYVELAKAFFEGSTEPGFVNAALDGVARDVRG